MQVKTASKKSNGAKIIKLADKIGNLRAIAYSPAPGWSSKYPPAKPGALDSEPLKAAARVA